MIREAIVLLGVFIYLQPSDAIRCFDCNSSRNPDCGEKFTNRSMPTTDCSNQQSPYDLRPIENCRITKYKAGGNDQWIYLRGCDRKEAMQEKFSEVYTCNTDYCNAALHHQPKLLLTLLFTSYLFIKLLRF